MLQKRLARAGTRQINIDNFTDGGLRAVRHHDHAVGQQDRLVHVVRDTDRGDFGPAPDLHQHFLQFPTGKAVEHTERLVGGDRARPARYRRVASSRLTDPPPICSSHPPDRRARGNIPRHLGVPAARRVDRPCRHQQRRFPWPSAMGTSSATGRPRHVRIAPSTCRPSSLIAPLLISFSQRPWSTVDLPSRVTNEADEFTLVHFEVEILDHGQRALGVG